MHQLHTRTASIPLLGNLHLGLLHIENHLLGCTVFADSHDQELGSTDQLVTRRQHFIGTHPIRLTDVRVVRIDLAKEATTRLTQLELQELHLVGARDNRHAFVAFPELPGYSVEDVTGRRTLDELRVRLDQLRGERLQDPHERNLHILGSNVLHPLTRTSVQVIHKIGG